MSIIPPPKPEWAPHDAVWIGFPSHPELWLEDIEPARAEVAAFARAVHAGGRGETVILVCADEEAAAAAKKLVGHDARIVVEPFGDIWLRDTGPIIGGDRIAHDFGFNGWGGKYDLQGDNDVGQRLARGQHFSIAEHGWILEGGAIDGDGTGLVVTTEQCLLNRNRNRGFSRADVETLLKTDLGFTDILWLGDGLANDHTDGHVDNLARFVGENRLLVPVAAGDDPNWRVYQDAKLRAESHGVEVVPFPSPGRVLGPEEDVVPASYMNFFIGNAAIVVPLYGQENDQAAIEALAKLFPGREILGQRADHILTGGGSFHCISQQIPSA
jgi:agmatine deiminase